MSMLETKTCVQWSLKDCWESHSWYWRESGSRHVESSHDMLPYSLLINHLSNYLNVVLAKRKRNFACDKESQELPVTSPDLKTKNKQKTNTKQNNKERSKLEIHFLNDCFLEEGKTALKK